MGNLTEKSGALGRMKIELQELADRHDKLAAFIDTPAFNGLPGQERDDLRAQYWSMDNYRTILQRRIECAQDIGSEPNRPEAASTNTFIDTDAPVQVTGDGSSETPIPFND